MRTLSGLDSDGNLLIAWEDQRAGVGGDFNDLIVRIELTPAVDMLI